MAMSRRLTSDRSPPLVFFDLEATGLISPLAIVHGMPDIIQIAAVDPDNRVFNRYVVPDKPMTASALLVTNMRVEDGELLHFGKPVTSVLLKEALSDFLAWLKTVSDNAGGQKPLLLAYSGTKFDFPLLKHSFRETGLTEKAKEVIDGFADVFEMAKAKIRKSEVGNYKLQSLARRFKVTSAADHNAINDAKALKGVFDVRLQDVVNIMIYRRCY